jgi:Fungal specific transcription factor domain
VVQNANILLWLLDHVASICLAIDYTENGYRMLAPVAMQEPALYNAMLAVSAAHRSRWERIQDTNSHKYLRKALVALQASLSDPEAAMKESTVCAILCLVSYEVHSPFPSLAPIVLKNCKVNFKCRFSMARVDGGSISKVLPGGSSTGATAPP